MQMFFHSWTYLALIPINIFSSPSTDVITSEFPAFSKLANLPVFHLILHFLFFIKAISHCNSALLTGNYTSTLLLVSVTGEIFVSPISSNTAFANGDRFFFILAKYLMFLLYLSYSIIFLLLKGYLLLGCLFYQIPLCLVC